ncbi:MAG: S9 family peptidase [Acidobacteriota bacterium]|nr:S9 family peptidase [Acidobacteriota bacterium]
MKPLRLVFCLMILLCFKAPAILAQQDSAKPPSKNEAREPRFKDGRKLLTALDLLKTGVVAGPKISPDGTRIAYTLAETKTEKDKEWKTVTQVWIVPMSPAGQKSRQYTRGEKSATAPEWSPDGKSLAFLSDREKDGERQVWMLSAEGGEAWAVTSHKGGLSGFRFSPDGKQLLLSAADQPSNDEEERKKVKDDTMVIDHDIKMTHLWLWNIDRKDEKRLTEGVFTVSDPQWSPDGTRITYTTRPTPGADDGSLSDLWLLTMANGEKKKLVENGSNDTARWSPDGKWIAYTGSPETHGGVTQSNLYLVAPAGGAPKQLTTNFALNVGTPVWSRDGQKIYFSTNMLEAIEVYSCDVSSGAVKQLSRHGGSTGIAEISLDGKTAVGTISGAQGPTEVYKTDLDFKRDTLLTDHNAWLKDYALAETQIVKWKSTDGTEVEGLLTKPVGYEGGKKLPLLLNPHGGPTGASLNNWNGTVQVLAANGFAVLQPNFRGSTGRGLAFAQANKNTWGKGDYEDCMTGVDAMIANGVADSDRLGAFGWSYGGYMTFWILTQTDRFKAVSPGAGLSNIYSMYSQTDIHRYMQWFYTDKAPWQATDLYWDRSPMKYINNVKTPTMILHGQVDTRVPIAQAVEFYQALKERRVPVEFVVYPRENHGFTEPRHQIDRVRRYVRFFAKYLGTPVVTEAAGQ